MKGRGARRQALAALLASGIVPPLLALLVYAPVLGHGLLWDDSVILERQLPGFTVSNAFAPPPGFHQWRYHYYRPVVVLSFMLDRALWGANPFGYHLTVLLLHAAASYAVFLLGMRLLSPMHATIAGACFAVFPLHAEPVGWIAGRSDVLAGLFGVLATAFFLKGMGFLPRAVHGSLQSSPRGTSAGKIEGNPSRGARKDTTIVFESRASSTPSFPAAETESETASPGSNLTLLGASAFLLAALLSKESAIALVPVLLAAAWIGGARRTAMESRWWWDVGAVLVPVAGYLTMRVLLNPGARTEAIPGGGAPGLQAVLGTGAFFPVHLLAPFGSPYRLAPPSGWGITLAAIGLVGLGAFAGFWSLVSRRWDLVLPLLWLASTCSVTAAAAAWNLTRTPVADRYLYMPAVGWCLLLAAMASLLDSRGFRRTTRGVVPRSEKPGSSDPEGNLGSSLASRDPAQRGASVSARTSPSGASRKVKQGSSVGDVGGGQTEEVSIRDRSGKRGPGPALSGAGWLGSGLASTLVAIYAFGALQRTPLYADELSFWTAAVAAEPSSGAARMNLGNALYAHGEPDRAMDSYRRALTLPLGAEDRSLALTDLGSVLYRQGLLEEAERTLREAAALAPNGPTENFNLGALLYQKGIASQSRGDAQGTRTALEEARVYLARTVALEVLHTRALMLLGHCDLYRGDAEAARRAWTRVLEIEGPNGAVGSEAAAALSRAGL